MLSYSYNDAMYSTLTCLTMWQMGVAQRGIMWKRKCSCPTGSVQFFNFHLLYGFLCQVSLIGNRRSWSCQCLLFTWCFTKRLQWWGQCTSLCQLSDTHVESAAQVSTCLWLLRSTFSLLSTWRWSTTAIRKSRQYHVWWSYLLFTVPGRDNFWTSEWDQVI